MKAYHIMGLSSWELGLANSQPHRLPEISGALQDRFEAILRTGLMPRNARPQDKQGRSFWQDNFAGDDRYIFLSLGERYSLSDTLPPACLYGFIFDAEALIRQGAILGIGDLMEDYDAIINDVIDEVAAELPRKPEIDPAELDRFMADCGGDDPAMREYIRLESMNPDDDLLEAIKANDLEFPGCRRAIILIQARIAALQDEKRLMGKAALQYLVAHPEEIGAGELEILVPGCLDVSRAEKIQGGNIYAGI